jgi:hypothetical protein
MKRDAALVTLGMAVLSSLTAQPLFEKNYGVVIGIDSYASPRWPKLSTAVSDARAIASYLQSQDYEVISLLGPQATKQAILETFQTILAPKLKARDRVLVFFAGHGDTETLGGREKGYIVPYDAVESSASFISVAELQEQSENMGNARHQLFLMDSCFGGLFATRGITIPRGSPNYIEHASELAARQILTAGGKNQRVLDGGGGGHSPFAAALLAGLRDGRADTDGDGYITFPELEAFIRSTASNRYQTPAAATLPGHEGGVFWFRAPQRPTGPGSEGLKDGFISDLTTSTQARGRGGRTIDTTLTNCELVVTEEHFSNGFVHRDGDTETVTRIRLTIMDPNDILGIPANAPGAVFRRVKGSYISFGLASLFVFSWTTTGSWRNGSWVSSEPAATDLLRFAIPGASYADIELTAKALSATAKGCQGK